MKVMVIGSGGREHAIVWKLAQSPAVTEIYCVPGNAGIGQIATCLDARADDVTKVVELAASNEVDVVVVGPEAPLVAGLVDSLEREGIRAFGPTALAARLEGSKGFAKEFMQRHGIPTADFKVFDDTFEAKAFLDNYRGPLVIKADGLAAGKGVILPGSNAEAMAVVDQLMVSGIFGESGRKVVIEQKLEGEEVSVLAFSDGQTVVPMVVAQDHKRAYDGDTGPNTGGMGAYAPVPFVSPVVLKQIMETILEPTVKCLKSEGVVYKGVLYAGLMITEEGPKVLEFNVRFGDPEAQVILPLLKSNFFEIISATVSGNLAQTTVEWGTGSAACVVLASSGYPGKYEVGKPILGLNEASQTPGVIVFHAGTAEAKFGDRSLVVTSGGRVLGVTGLGCTLKEAIDNAYTGVKAIHFEGMHYRRDIGSKALRLTAAMQD